MIDIEVGKDKNRQFSGHFPEMTEEVVSQDENQGK